jgi:hypothetical protein
VNEELDKDEIRLAVPAQPAFARVARAAAGGLAARLGFSYDEVEEVRLATGEAWAATLGSDSRDGQVVLLLRAVDDGVLELRLTVPVAPGGGCSDDFSEGEPMAVLEALAEDVDLAPDRSCIRLLLRSAG